MTNSFPSDSIWGHLSLTHFSRGSSCLSTVNWGQIQPGHGARSSQRWTQSWQRRTSPLSPSHRWLALKERSSRVMRWAVTSEHPNTSIHRACAHLVLIPSLPFPWRGECVKEQSKQVRPSCKQARGEMLGSRVDPVMQVKRRLLSYDHRWRKRKSHAFPLCLSQAIKVYFLFYFVKIYI